MSRSDEAFAELFRTWSPRVFGYAARQVGAQVAEDVVADTFLIAWRRRSSLPDEPLPWLLVTARNTIANRRRTDARQLRLVNAVAEFERAATPARGTAEQVAERAATLEALARLNALEREALLLVAWDGLTARDAAAVAGCSRRAFEARLARARARVENTLAGLVPACTGSGEVI